MSTSSRRRLVLARELASCASTAAAKRAIRCSAPISIRSQPSRRRRSLSSSRLASTRRFSRDTGPLGPRLWLGAAPAAGAGPATSIAPARAARPATELPRRSRVRGSRSAPPPRRNEDMARTSSAGGEGSAGVLVRPSGGWGRSRNCTAVEASASLRLPHPGACGPHAQRHFRSRSSPLGPLQLPDIPRLARQRTASSVVLL